MRELDFAFERIEQSMLPTIAAMLDAVIDAAAGARPGIDADHYARELRLLAEQTAAATSTIQDIVRSARLPEEYFTPGHADAA